MLDIFYDNVKFIYLSRRRNIQQDNLIISNNEKKSLQKTEIFGRIWVSVGWGDDEIWREVKQFMRKLGF